MASTVNNMASTFSACSRSLALSSAPRPRSGVAPGRWHAQPQIGQQLQAELQGLVGVRDVAAPLKGLKALAPLVRCMATAAGASVPATAAPSRSISVGEKLPEAELSYFDQEGNIQVVKVSELTKGKKVVLFAVPGAFTPTCSQKHLPGFLEKADELRAKGVDTIACVSVNDTFVLRAWGESVGVGDKVLLLSDGNAVFTKALGVSVDLSDKPALLGIRSRRYALLADDGVVKVLNLEEGGAFTISGPEEILKAL